MKNSIIIGLDIDDVISNTSLLMLGLLREKFNIICTRKQMTGWRYHKSLPITLEQEIAAFDIFHDGFCEKARLNPGALRGVNRLSSWGKIWLITARPERTMPYTENWLKTKCIRHDKLIHTGRSHDKIKLAKDLNIMIEDNGYTANEFAEAGIYTILFRRPWNAQFKEKKNLQVVTSWSQIINVVGNYVDNTRFREECRRLTKDLKNDRLTANIEQKGAVCGQK